MKHTLIVLFSMALVLAGCAVTQQADLSPEKLEVISMTPLPPLKPTMPATGLKITVLVHVMKDGSIENARLVESSGDSEWDSLALQSIRQWRYATPRRNGVVVDFWARQSVNVRVMDPVVMALGELSFASQQEADSMYVLLERGEGLDALFRQHLQTVNIMTYPARVRDLLKTLGENEYTHPVSLGERYVIYKRFPRTLPLSVPG